MEGWKGGETDRVAWREGRREDRSKERKYGRREEMRSGGSREEWKAGGRERAR